MVQDPPLLIELSRQIRVKFSIDKLLFYTSFEVESHVTKKNNRPIFKNRRSGSMFLGKDKTLQRAENELITHLKLAKHSQGLKDIITERVWGIFHFIFEPQSYYTAKKAISLKLPDLDNLLALPLDCLQKAEVIANDSLFDSFDLSRRLVGEKNKLEIFLLKYDA